MDHRAPRLLLIAPLAAVMTLALMTASAALIRVSVASAGERTGLIVTLEFQFAD